MKRRSAVRHPAHHAALPALRRIEGQVRGIQRMVEEQAYCPDIITQVHAAVSALYRVSEDILARHLEHCVTDAFSRRTRKEREEKILEILRVVKELHRLVP